MRVVSETGALVHRSYGFQDRDTKRPVDGDTIYHWASITKTLTGIATMQLRDRGLLSLDDPIVRYVPELNKVHNPFGSMEAITIRHLLSHSAGFRGGTWPWGGDKPWHPHEPTEWSQLVAMMPYTEVEFAPGSKFSYSNPGIVFVATAIERIVGEPWEVYVEKNILRPLGMTRAFFDRAPHHLLKHRSHSYWVSKGTTTEARFDFDTGITVSNGGLNAPLGDMEKYVRFLMGASETPDGASVLSRSSLEEMWRPIVRVDSSGTPELKTPPGRVDMGLTFFVEERGGRRLVGHSGGQEGFISHFYVDPALRLGYVVAFNTHAQDDVAVPNTRNLDAEIRDAFVSELKQVVSR